MWDGNGFNYSTLGGSLRRLILSQLNLVWSLREACEKLKESKMDIIDLRDIIDNRESDPETYDAWTAATPWYRPGRHRSQCKSCCTDHHCRSSRNSHTATRCSLRPCIRKNSRRALSRSQNPWRWFGPRSLCVLRRSDFSKSRAVSGWLTPQAASYRPRWGGFWDVMSLGSVIFIIPLKTMLYGGLSADFAKLRSNDFNRLGGKCANRR
jgi:hypothetical protein